MPDYTSSLKDIWMLRPCEIGDITGKWSMEVVTSEGHSHWGTSGLHVEVELPFGLEPVPAGLANCP